MKISSRKQKSIRRAVGMYLAFDSLANTASLGFDSVEIDHEVMDAVCQRTNDLAQQWFNRARKLGWDGEFEDERPLINYGGLQL